MQGSFWTSLRPVAMLFLRFSVCVKLPRHQSVHMLAIQHVHVPTHIPKLVIQRDGNQLEICRADAPNLLFRSIGPAWHDVQHQR